MTLRDVPPGGSVTNVTNSKSVIVTIGACTAAVALVAVTVAVTVYIVRKDIDRENADYMRSALGVKPTWNCKFPFKYQGTKYNECIQHPRDKYYWCSHHYNYRGQWDFCIPQSIVRHPRCHFPFTYKNHSFTTCTGVESRNYWCGTAANVNEHNPRRWVYCYDTAAIPDKSCRAPYYYKHVHHDYCIPTKTGQYWCTTPANGIKKCSHAGYNPYQYTLKNWTSI